MKNFEQLHENILLDNKVVFTLAQLEKYVEDKELNLDYETRGEGGSGMVCDPNTSFYEVEVITPVSEYLDIENNFQSACNDLYELSQPYIFPFGHKQGFVNTKNK